MNIMSISDIRNIGMLQVKFFKIPKVNLEVSTKKAMKHAGDSFINRGCLTKNNSQRHRK